VKTILDSFASSDQENEKLRKKLIEESTMLEEARNMLKESVIVASNALNAQRRAESELSMLQSRLHKEIRDEVAEETERLVALEKQCIALQDEIYQITSNCNSIKLDYSRLQSENSQLQLVIAELNRDSEKSRIESLQHQVSDLQETLSKANNQIQEYDKMQKSLQLELESERVNVLRQHKEISDLRSHIQSRENFHQKIHDEESEKIRKSTYDVMKLVSALCENIINSYNYYCHNIVY
jgi:chromosome segregation ATPase